MLILVILSITIMILDQHVAAVSRVRVILAVAVVPLQYTVSWPVHFINKLRNTMTTHDELVKENLDLKAQQLLLKTQVQRLLAIEIENNQLKALSRTSKHIQGKVLITQLLAVDVDPLVHQIVLDKGGHDNVFVGQPVLDADGVMGQVIQVNPFTSRVLLINDPQSGIPAEITRNGIRAILMGDGYTGKLRLVNVPKTVDIKVGDILITSGLGDYFPEGYPIGRVISVKQDPGLQFATIIVDPDAHLNRAREVLLVWPDREVKSKKVITTVPQQKGVAPSHG